MSPADSNEVVLRAFALRIIGWSEERAPDVERALRTIRLSVAHHIALVLLGDDGDLVPIALSLHRLAVGREHPFVTCHARQPDRSASVRSPMNRASGVAAVRAARGGSICVVLNRLPRDYSALVAELRDPASDAQVIVCGSGYYERDPFLIRPVPIRIPPLRTRASELPRVVDEYAAEALGMLGVGAEGFTPGDRRWVIDRAARSLAEIQRATLRRVAIRKAGTLVGAAGLLAMSHVALSRWFTRRRRRKVAP